MSLTAALLDVLLPALLGEAVQDLTDAELNHHACERCEANGNCPIQDVVEAEKVRRASRGPVVEVSFEDVTFQA